MYREDSVAGWVVTPAARNFWLKIIPRQHQPMQGYAELYGRHDGEMSVPGVKCGAETAYGFCAFQASVVWWKLVKRSNTVVDADLKWLAETECKTNWAAEGPDF
jgi:hypothetical protein